MGGGGGGGGGGGCFLKVFADVKLAVECLQIVFVIYCIVVFKGNGDCRFCVCENTAFIVFTLKMKGMLMKYLKKKKKKPPHKGLCFLCGLLPLFFVVSLGSEVLSLLCSLCLH